MSKHNEKSSIDLELEKELSRYWFCPNDKNMLQIHHTKQSQSPYFVINKQHIEIAIQNAISLRKIAPEAKEQTQELVDFIFKKNPVKEMIDLVGVSCNVCGAKFSAPKLSKIENGEFSKDRARALFESTRALETKTFGPFRIVDHFGLSRFVRGNQQSSRSGIFWMWILGLRTILMMIVLYYILGLEMRIRKRWVPLGPILFIGGLIAIIIFGFYWNIIEVIGNAFGGFY